MRNQTIKQFSLNLLVTFIISSFLIFLLIRIYYAKDVGSLEGNQGIFIMILAGINLVIPHGNFLHLWSTGVSTAMKYKIN